MPTALIAGFQFGYNRENSKLYSQDLTQTALSEVYQYDSVYRIADFQRGTLVATKDAVAGTPTQSQAWQLDGVGNWAMTSVNGIAQPQTISAMNEYSSFAGTANTHDLNGNLSDDGDKLLTFDFANRLVEVRKKSDNSLIVRYTYDAFNRRTSKYFSREVKGEYKPDVNTIALYHFNESTGPVQDASGNGNHGTPSHKHVKQGVEGLWNTKAIEFDKGHVHIPKSASLNSISDKLTVETWVYLQAKKHGEREDDEHSKAEDHGKSKYPGGTLIHRPGSYKFDIGKKTGKARFTLLLQASQKPGQDKHERDRDDDDPGDADDPEEDDHCDQRTSKVQVTSNIAIPQGEWLHLAAVYDGQQVRLYVNGTAQSEERQATGMVKQVQSKLHMGCNHFNGKLEEVRISNTVRTRFSSSKEWVLRTSFYAGWRIIEERERTAPEGQPLGAEILTRQFTDGGSIDEHLTQDVYGSQGSTITQTLWYHESARGDTVAVTDGSGNVTLRLCYDAYGQAYKLGANGALEALTDGDGVKYGFQGREIDQETGLLYFRNRYYSASQGRFLQRDPMGYVDGLGLHEFVGGNPFEFSDALGNINIRVWHQWKNKPTPTQVKLPTLQDNFTLAELKAALEELKQKETSDKKIGGIEELLKMLCMLPIPSDFKVEFALEKESKRKFETKEIRENGKLVGARIHYPNEDVFSDMLLHELVHVFLFTDYKGNRPLMANSWAMKSRGENPYQFSLDLLRELNKTATSLEQNKQLTLNNIIQDVVSSQAKPLTDENLAEMVRLNYLFNLGISQELFSSPFSKNNFTLNASDPIGPLSPKDFDELKNLLSVVPKMFR